MSKSLQEFLQQIHTVENEILEEYASQWDEYTEPRKTLVTEAGKTERYLYFVVEGIQRSYYINEGKEHVIAFTYPPSFSGIPDSFLVQKPSKYYLETITESRFLRLSYERHQQLMEKYRPIETLFRKAIERIFIGVLERHYELMAYTIEERFKAFMKRSPHLLNMVPHKDLASYLRIDPTNFSKLLSSVRL
ncbi:cyclic nucleotide-binding domain-containing protein [Aliifodinibius sp. S!AR15-10]|uniref:Crp/Fnr family transcriptional regulator n=1 Tax=Aliifodinibius sp. S!AR15-10 TaxID=2950437 RepID=UPI00285F25BA|nr:cyclic nucleotide-binding domain-containing protein [Aliifodinibius sp. S!AR15-10]MDR8392640.1 cyclic nucleotide-binding domain-containing protein [Aliifodinibius sp. S!AR15-10]